MRRFTCTGRSSSATARSIWDNFWYAGTYPLASYSLLYYLPAALVGNLPLVFAAAVASTMLFSSIALREWGRAALWPSRIFGVLAAAPLFTRRIRVHARLRRDARDAQAAAAAPASGSRRSRGAHGRLQPARLRLPLPHRRVVRRLAAADRRPLSLVRRRLSPSRRGSRPLALVLFPGGTGTYPFHWIDFASVLVVSALGVLVARRARGARALVCVLRALGARQHRGLPRAVAARGQLDAAERLRLPGHAPHREPRRLPAAAPRRARARGGVSPTTSSRTRLLVPSRLDNNTQQASFWRPAIRFLRGARAAGLPRRGRADGGALGGVLDPEGRLPARARLVPAARHGRQPGPVPERISTPDAYRSWLRSNAVRYVLLSTTAPLDWDGGPQEASVVRSPTAGLKVVFRSRELDDLRAPARRRRSSPARRTRS